MSYLAINLSQEVNGVSRLHGKVTQQMFTDLWKGYNPDELHIGYVTNGVHFPTKSEKAFQFSLIFPPLRFNHLNKQYFTILKIRQDSYY